MAWGHGGFMGALPGFLEESSPRSTACQALWGRSSLPLSSVKTVFLSSPIPALSKVPSAWKAYDKYFSD